jgi:hypothetical protein
MMEITNFNGHGRWSVQAIQERYLEYARQLKVSPTLDLKPREQGHPTNGRLWIYPIMDQVIGGIEKGDKACIEIGVECIEENQWLAFGRVIKANTARALRRSTLTPQQIERLRKYIVSMLIEEHTPGHYREYAKLLRKIGLGNYWPMLEEQVNCNNPYVFRFYKYFQQYAQHE